jgi:cell division septation protein DedD
MMDQGSVRNLEEIQEQDHGPRTPRGASAVIVVLGGACVVFAVLALGGRRSAPATAPADPLGDLIAQHPHGGPSASARLTDLRPSDVTFPSMLSDDKNPPTALAAVRAMPALGASDAPAASAVPPPPTDRLSVMPVPAQPPPLPAQNVLEATPVITRPRDGLTKAASDSAQLVTAGAPSVAAGHDGGYQLQVSSFRAQSEANDFGDQLRARGHKAYVQEAHVTGRGTWFRVRVGPFATQHAAAAYRSSFEAKEHVVPFIVPPSVKDSTPAPAPAPVKDATH